MPTPRFVALMPVKPPARGKSRLGDLGGRGPVRRSELAEAFALDTLAACRAAGRVGAVLVATDDADFASRVRAAGGTAIPDGVAGDLNETLRQAAAEARRRWPDLVPVAVCADLPALRAEDLDAALASAADRVSRDQAAFVGDAEQAGTTLYAAPHALFAPRFGADSFTAHDHDGAHPLRGSWPTLRRDVDDVDDLAAAATLGLGPHTTSLLDTSTPDSSTPDGPLPNGSLPNGDGPPPVGDDPSMD